MVNINKLNGGDITITTGGSTKTRITFTDGTTKEYDWSGDIKLGSLPISDTNDFYDWNTYTWTKHPKIVNLGTKVTGIDDSMFQECTELTTITIPNTVTYFGNDVFPTDDGKLNSIVFKGRTLANVQAMDGYPWGIINTNIISVSN